MSKKGKETEVKKVVLGRVKHHLKMGVVGLPNVGKSSLFNILTNTSKAKADNFPFCTIEPNEAQVPIPDDRFNWLCETYQPVSKVPGYLEVWDIAGLVKGASEGEGLGNAFLSNINSVDGIFHVIRLFEDSDVTHVEGDVNPIRDIEIIESELRLKDISHVKKAMIPTQKLASSDPKQRPTLAIYEKILAFLEDGKDVKDGDWNNKEVDILNTMLLLTSKPVVYLINMSANDYARKKNKWLGKLVKWLKEHHPEGQVLPVSISLEEQILPLSEEERESTLASYGENVRSTMDKIVQSGFSALNLITFFTSGKDEVRAWPLMSGSKAPQAAGTIHGDFEKCFIRAEVMSYDDLHELGTEAEVRNKGKFRTEGKNYVVSDGDIMVIKHNAGGAGKKK